MSCISYSLRKVSERTRKRRAPRTMLVLSCCAVVTLAGHAQPSSTYKQKDRTFHTPSEFERLTGGRVRLQRQQRPLTDAEVPRRSPVRSFTVMAAESPSVAWFGTREGAIRFSRDSSSLEYFHGRRWLPADHVTGIGFDGNATWLETPKGFARIEYKTMTLEDKSRHFVDRIQARHTRWGLTADSHLQVAGDLSTNQMMSSDNDGL